MWGFPRLGTPRPGRGWFEFELHRAKVLILGVGDDADIGNVVKILGKLTRSSVTIILPVICGPYTVALGAKLTLSSFPPFSRFSFRLFLSFPVLSVPLLEGPALALQRINQLGQ